MLYIWNNKDLSPSAPLPPETAYTLGDKNHKPRPLVPNGQGHADGKLTTFSYINCFRWTFNSRSTAFILGMLH